MPSSEIAEGSITEIKDEMDALIPIDLLARIIRIHHVYHDFFLNIKIIQKKVHVGDSVTENVSI